MTDRVAKLAEHARERGVQAVAVVPGANLRYLTGLDFHLSERLTVAFFPTDGQPCMVVPAMEAPRTSEHSRVALQLYPWSDADGPTTAVQRCVTDLQLAGRRIAAEYTGMRLLEFRAIESAAPGIQVEDAVPLMARLRTIKDNNELAAMRAAVRIVEEALRAAIDQVRAGMTERELAYIWEQHIRAAGSQSSFSAIVASGPNAANPHHNNSDRAFQLGDLVIMDGGAVYNGYVSDITRTIAVGEPSSQARHIYELVLAANQAGQAAARPGATGEAIDRATRAVIEAGGYGKYFVHRTGHGLGLEIHEPPFIVAGSQDPLPAGATFTIEPGIYIGGLCGVRIEDDIVLTSNGAESLTTFERELIVCGV